SFPTSHTPTRPTTTWIPQTISRKTVAAVSLVRAPWFRATWMMIWANGNHDRITSRIPTRSRSRCDCIGVSGPQVLQDRKHAAMVLLVGREVELGEDARHVLLDRPRRDEHALGDRLVRPPLRHQLDHLALARRQL